MFQGQAHGCDAQGIRMQDAMRVPRTRLARGVAVLCGLSLLLLSVFDASAMRRITPGMESQLAPDEGLLVVAFDTDVPVVSARFTTRGGAFSRGVLNYLERGRSIGMYAVKAGAYRWERIDFTVNASGRTYFDLADDPEYGFEVRAGQVNYAGDLVFRPSSLRNAVIHRANRSLAILDWLKAQFPAIASRTPFGYSGHFPDPFPAFYRDALARADDLPDDLNAGAPPPPASDMPIAPKLMWTPTRVRDVTLSPDGTLVVVEIREADGTYVLELLDIAAGTRQRIYKSARGFGTVAWESQRILVATSPSFSPVYGDEGETLSALRIGEPVNGVRKVQALKGPTGGRIVDLTSDSPGRLLYEAYDSRGQLIVHEVDLTDQRAIGGFRRTKSSARLNKAVPDDLAWYADGHGRLRAALAKRGDDRVLMYGQGIEFREVLRYGGDDGFRAERLSHDGDLIYGLSDQGRAQRELVVFDPAQGKVTRTLFSKPGVDVVAGLFDERRNPIGATYYEDGLRISHYFDADTERVVAGLAAQFPGQTITPGQRSVDGSRMLLWVDASDAPPQLHYLDVARNSTQLLDEVLPQLIGRSFAPTRLINAQGVDGLSIQAFLTLPAGAGKRPLVVMPHGGPIGIADSLHFDREVQFIASLGYAVLQVNFRGSDGYGRAFREAGRRQFGTGIENDIDAALRAALAKYPLDESRMCILGTSYGGYSALISAIRWPERFRCAVSIAGVSDRLLTFTASDSARSANGRGELVKLMGDPHTDEAMLVEASPLYQYRKLTVPVMLIHGREDLRVDFEHTRRLVRMLNLDHRTPVVQAFPNEGHGLTDPKALDIAWTGVAGFLQKYLGEAAH